MVPTTFVCIQANEFSLFDRRVWREAGKEDERKIVLHCPKAT